MSKGIDNYKNKGGYYNCARLRVPEYCDVWLRRHTHEDVNSVFDYSQGNYISGTSMISVDMPIRFPAQIDSAPENG
jgi:hypothetical protein